MLFAGSWRYERDLLFVDKSSLCSWANGRFLNPLLKLKRRERAECIARRGKHFLNKS